MKNNLIKKYFSSNKDSKIGFSTKTGLNFDYVIPKLKSVVNIERSDFYPFLHPVVKGYLPSLKESASSYAKVFPKDIDEFLKKQEMEFICIKFFILAGICRYIFNLLIKGRSNVGKSSLINAILENKETQVSKTPGKTNFLQFIYLPQIELSLVDCPGYGYACRSQKERKEWNKMIQTYLLKNKFLKRLFILVDGEVGIGEMDENCIKMASFSKIEYNIVLTKVDKLVKKEDLIERVERCKSVMLKYQYYNPFIFLTSCKDMVGLEELKCYLLFLNIMQEEKPPFHK